MKDQFKEIANLIASEKREYNKQFEAINYQIFADGIVGSDSFYPTIGEATKGVYERILQA